GNLARVAVYAEMTSECVEWMREASMLPAFVLVAIRLSGSDFLRNTGVTHKVAHRGRVLASNPFFRTGDHSMLRLHPYSPHFSSFGFPCSANKTLDSRHRDPVFRPRQHQPLPKIAPLS